MADVIEESWALAGGIMSTRPESLALCFDERWRPTIGIEMPKAKIRFHVDASRRSRATGAAAAAVRRARIELEAILKNTKQEVQESNGRKRNRC